MIVGGKIVKKVVFELSDGRKVVASHRGAPLLWEEEDLESLRQNFQRHGHPHFTTDLQHYDVSLSALRQRFPKDTLVEVVGFQTINPVGRPPKEYWDDPNSIYDRFYEEIDLD